MPPWVASVPRSTFFRRRKAIDRFSSAFSSRTSRSPLPRHRSASTHVSPTAINFRPSIPPRNEALYNALSELNGRAEQYVNSSRLQLALRGLATQDAVTRIAVVGLNSQLAAQRLTRLLLADPLGKEEGWEKELEKRSEKEPAAILLRFGDESDAYPPSPLYRTLSTRSRILGTHNLEVLVSTLNVNVSGGVTSPVTESSKDAVLVPKLRPTSPRSLPVAYPVHKTLVVGEGLNSAISFGRFTSDSVDELSDMVKVAIELPAPETDPEPTNVSKASAINLDIGTEALTAIRTSVQNSIAYEHGWFKSGLPWLSKWLTQGLEPVQPIKRAHRIFISSIAEEVDAGIACEEAQQLSKLASIPADAQMSTEMVGYLEAWAEKSHTELRDQLDEAFASKNWRKLGWWKLFWRVDDVSMVTEEILERKWLVDAEKEAIYLAGRMKQAGFPEDLPCIGTEVGQETETTTPGMHLPRSDPSPTPPQMDLSTDVRDHQPWPNLISNTRASLVSSSLPPLQSLAQRLVLTTLSTTTLSSALSALLYVSVPSLQLLEAGVVAALGLVFSLRRMQKVWEGTREMWQGRVREEGRLCLKGVEDVVRMIIRGKGKAGRRDEGAEERKAAREAVKNVREALERM